MLRRDLNYTFRQWAKHPGVTLVVLITLALGIGANTAIFSVINGVLLRPLPYADSERLVVLWPDGALPEAGYVLVHSERRSFRQVAGYTPPREVVLTGGEEPARLEAVMVTAGFFSTLGVPAQEGDTFRPGADQPGHQRTAVLSHSLWQTRFGGDPEVVGRTVVLDGTPRTVVGVMPGRFRFPSGNTDLWLPVTLDPSQPVKHWGGAGSLRMLARLPPGATLEQARAELPGLIARIREGFPWKMPESYGQSATVVTLRSHLVGDIEPTLWILATAVGFVLLIACVNVANVLLARSTVRQREIAVRAAMGADRPRIVRQLLTESAALGVAGACLALFLAFATLRTLILRLPPDMPRVTEIAIDWRVLLFALVLGLATGLAFGVLPAARSSRLNMQAALKEGGRGLGEGRAHRWLSKLLVVSEVTLAVVLVVGAGLLIRSFWSRLQLDSGLQPQNVVSAKISPPEFSYPDEVRRRIFTHELLDRLEALPGVDSAAGATHLPFAAETFGAAFLIDGEPVPEGGNWPFAETFAEVSPRYFQVLGVPLLDGRSFGELDRDEAPPVALVSQALAERHWPDGSAVGQRIQLAGERTWLTVVGIVGDVKVRQLTDAPTPALYRPLFQGRVGDLSVVVRSTAEPETVAAEIRSATQELDPSVPVSDIRTMEQWIAESLAEPRFTMSLVSLFALLAILLGGVGIYGVLSYTVSQSTHDIAVRMALGAEPKGVRWMVLRQGFLLSVLGIVLGICAALATSRVLSALLYGVSTRDPLTYAAVPLILLTLAIIACGLPARRATRIDPMLALRSE